MAATTAAKALKVIKQSDTEFEESWRKICDRRAAANAALFEEVAERIEKIRVGGDRALIAAIEQHDGVELDRVEVTPAEWDLGCESVPSGDRAAIGKAAMRIREFHRKRIPSSWEMREEGGGYMGQRVRPLARVGVFVCGAERQNPSSVIMNTTPASVVEVPEIVLATPADESGTVPPEILMAARVSGVHRVFKMGGAHALAALAHGTVSVPRVDKIVGSGGADVAAAKQQLYGVISVAAESGGPRELCIIADKGATPSWIAADLISQAEYAEDGRILFVTHVKGLVTKVVDQLTRQLKALGPAGKSAKKVLASGGIAIVTKKLEDSIALANEYAPEHLVLAVDQPEIVSKLVENAGAIYMGHYTPVAVGEYLAGPNHVLPRGGTARFFSPLGVDDFLKRTSFVKFEPPKLRELGLDVIRLAEVEGNLAHGKAIDLRLQRIRRARREREAAREAEL
ncbi:MAG: histidinol dehydrogenase [Actinomycetota bacterium]|nr:histidinol dehydrogenase [Actinomycetota bacterium]